MFLNQALNTFFTYLYGDADYLRMREVSVIAYWLDGLVWEPTPVSTSSEMPSAEHILCLHLFNNLQGPRSSQGGSAKLRAETGSQAALVVSGNILSLESRPPAWCSLHGLSSLQMPVPPSLDLGLSYVFSHFGEMHAPYQSNCH